MLTAETLQGKSKNRESMQTQDKMNINQNISRETNKKLNLKIGLSLTQARNLITGQVHPRG